MVRVGRNLDGSADVAMNAGKGHGEHERVPGAQDPGSFRGDIEREDRSTGDARQMNRSGLGDISRTARAIDGECHESAVFEFALQFAQRLQSAAGTRSPDWAKAEAFDDARYVFSVVTSAGEYA